MLNDPVWEPLWAACQATGLSLNTHGGGGEHYPYEGPGAQAMYMMETAWRTRRGVWVMILGGTFARYPGLKLVLTEQWIDWSTQVMSDMDGLFHGPNGISLRASLGKAPSDYFREHCYFGASFLSNWEARFAIEHDLVGNTMWGDDYPHPEGTWPHTREAMAHTFSGIDPKFVAPMLGEVAIDVYGLDRAKLQRRGRSHRPLGRRSLGGWHPARGRDPRSLRLPHRRGTSSMSDGTELQSPPCRMVTDEEVEHLQQHGWVQLKRFVDPRALSEILEVAREQMGEDGDSNPLHPFVEAAVAEGGAGLKYFNAHSAGGLRNPVLRPVIEQVGKNAQRLLRRRRPDGSPLGIRFYQDLLAPKLPSSKTSRHGGNGPTSFHQDFITFAVDRTGGMTFWIPLEALRPRVGDHVVRERLPPPGRDGRLHDLWRRRRPHRLPGAAGPRDVGADASTSSATSPSTHT